MNIKKFLPYIGALVALVVAILAIVNATSTHTDTPASWDQLAESVKQVGTAADLAADAAVQSKDRAVCLTSKSASGLARGVAESAVAAKDGTCRIPDVEVDVTACMWDLTIVAPAEAPVVEGASAEAPVVAEAPVAEAAPVTEPVKAEETPVADASEPDAAPAPAPEAQATIGVDVPAAVEVAVGPLVTLVKGLVEKSDATHATKAWATGVLTWIDSGRPSIVALVENPTSGKLSFKGVDIEGCKP